MTNKQERWQVPLLIAVIIIATLFRGVIEVWIKSQIGVDY